MTVMLIGGLWHGASWNFVIWGGIHGGMLCIERIQGKESLYARAPRALRVTVTFAIVCVGWVFFRAADLEETWRYLRSMAGLAIVGPGQEVIGVNLFTPYHVLMFGVCAAIVWFAPQTWNFTQTFSRSRAAVCFALFLASITVMWTQTVNPFLYFQF